MISVRFPTLWVAVCNPVTAFPLGSFRLVIRHFGLLSLLCVLLTITITTTATIYSEY